MPFATLTLYHRARHIARWVIGLGIAGAGASILYDGAGGLAAARFSASSFAPYWFWGAWAFAAGIATIVPRTRIAGLVASAAWFATWGVILALGVIRADGALYPTALYLMMLTQALLVAIVDKGTTTKAAP